MRAANLLLLELMLQGATANIIVNPYTEYNEPPPDAVACSSTGYCQGIAECGGVAYCADVGSGRTCMEKLASGSAGVPANACSDPQAKGFIKCESGQLYRHCSPRNRDGGMYDTTGLQSPPSTPPTPPAPSPFPPPAPQSPPPDFANQVEGQLFFLGFGLIVLLIVATVRFSLRRCLSLHLPAHLMLIDGWCFPRMAVGLPVSRALADGLRAAREVGGRREQGYQRADAQGTRPGGTFDQPEPARSAARLRAPLLACSLKRAVCLSLGGVQLTFITRWVCIENGLEVFVEFVNYAASVNATMGSPNSFYIAFGVNLGMVILELVEHCRTRRNGGKQTPWDRFWFGQVGQGSSNPRDAKSQAIASALTDPCPCCADAPAQWADATRKNYYAKYSTRILLFFGFLLNMAMFPLVLINVNDVTSTYASEDEAGSLYFTQVEMVMVRKAAHETRRAHSSSPPQQLCASDFAADLPGRGSRARTSSSSSRVRTRSSKTSA